MPLEATPKSPTANSYITEADATAYLQGERLYTDAWDAVDVATRERALIWATQLLDNSYDWYGTKTTLEQALRHPRIALEDLDGDYLSQDLIAPQLEKGTALYALSLLENNRVIDPVLTTLGLSEASIGSISAKIDSSNVEDFVPDEVDAMLAPLGEVLAVSQRGDKTVNVRRS